MEGPDDAGVVMVLFHDGGNGPGDAYAIGTHVEVLFLAIFIQVGGIKGGGIFGTELEDISHFDAPTEEEFLAVFCQVAFLDHQEVWSDFAVKVSAVAGVDVVVAFLVSTHNQVVNLGQGLVQDDPGVFQVHGPGEAGIGSTGQDGLVVHFFNGVFGNLGIGC